MMSDIFFSESAEVPVPQDEVRILKVNAEARVDGQRVDVRIELTPFQKRPNIDVLIERQNGEQVSALSVVEAIDHKMDFTMHIRGPKRRGEYTLSVGIFYADIEEYQEKQEKKESSGEILSNAKQIIDEKQFSFEIE